MSSVISPSTLTLLRRIKEDAMLDTVTVETEGDTVILPSGGWTYTEGGAVTTKGMIGPLSKTAIERFQAERLEYTGLEQLDVPLSAEIDGVDKVTVLSARHGTTRQYTVEGVTPLSTYAVSRTAIVKAIT